ncbi:copper homeostasis protein CutC [uncultured Gemella sp.]|uniref:copper homeostasis protein CutC n=1 Tax=uncultured Gemella sp. TaxID=254352 RepID=UPI0028D29804|nr:copper homeostasis protein CutC [uncultured Gemella sp.]
MIKIEVCANSVQDCIVAQNEGADRIELISASYLGGLTPTTTTLDIVIENGVKIPIMGMVRPRGGGFCYSEIEKEQMYREARELLRHGAKGIVFGFLNEDRKIDWEATEKMINLCKSFEADSVFHRAFDCSDEPECNIQHLIELGCTRVLTSGLEANVDKGTKLLKLLQEKFGDRIEILAGAGISTENIESIIKKTGVTQVHGTFKKYGVDQTTTGMNVTYRYTDKGDYEEVNPKELTQAVQIVKRLNEE